MVCVKLTVSGRVQGVGFRWFIKQKADNLGLKGYVRNLSNGNVEIEAEGDDTKVDELLNHAQRGPGFANVANIDVERKDYTGSYGAFEITH